MSLTKALLRFLVIYFLPAKKTFFQTKFHVKERKSTILKLRPETFREKEAIWLRDLRETKNTKKKHSKF